MSTTALSQVAMLPADSDSLPQSLSLGSRYGTPDLTIHRRTESHHGQTLRTLGHAAEHLVITRSYSIEQPETAADREAVRILMRLSREVFEEYAVIVSHHHPVSDWIMARAVRIYGAA